MVKLKAILLLIFVAQSIFVSAQINDKHSSEFARFYNAEDLFEKQKYSASQKEYETFINEQKDENHPYVIKARFYYALNSLYLYHPESESLLRAFLTDYPETIYRPKIYFELGKHYYRKRKYDETIEWLSKMETYDLTEEEKAEYYFKLGYANFRENNLKASRNAFHEIVESKTKYQAPALYYYSHISYTEKSYQTALDGFTKLKENPAFKETVPYYITQIYYLQGKYDKVISLAPDLSEKDNAKYELGMSHLIGDAFYKVGKYDEAVPFLEEYNNKSTTTRDEDYQLGYAYFKSNNYKKAITMFDKVANVKDKLAQVSLYHIGDAYLKQDNFFYARNAFELASKMSFDKEIEEDALYNYAILSYKLDYNPFDEAVIALNQYLNKYPNSKRSQDVQEYLINVYTTMKNYKSAMAAIENISDLNIRMKSTYQMMAFNHGVEQFQSSQLESSIGTFKKVKTYPIDPTLNSKSFYWMGEAYFKLSDYSNSIVWYRKFLEEPGSYSLIEHNDAYYNIAYAYFRQEDWESAIQSFRTFTQDEAETHKEKVTDAYLRIGDAYYKQGGKKVSGADDKAILFYQKAIDTKGGQEDYAKFQMGKTYGYKGNYDKKASAMLDIVNDFPSSTFAVPALYEVAESHRLLENDIKAKLYYTQLITDYPKHNLVKDAVFQIGMLHFRNLEYVQAEKQFLRILNEFNDESKKKEAMARLKNVYTALNQPEKYIALLGEYNIDFSNGAKDTLYFDNAYDLYEDTSWVASINAFNSYFNTFSNPIFELEGLYFSADAYQKNGDDENANGRHSQLLLKPQNRFTERSASFSAQYEYENENYSQAVIQFQKLLQSASYPQNSLIANIGIMRSYALQDLFEEAKQSAEAILISDQALDYVQTESHFVIAKAYMINSDLDNAIPHFTNVIQNSNGEIAAESQYNIALIYNLQEDYTTSEQEVRLLMKNNAGYSFWVAKALILQAKNSMGKEDYVQAEYTLNSVLNGYSTTDDGILDEANEVMQVLLSIKNKAKDLEDDSDNIIEINEGGNND
jgi:tetratricopeptide (TPR) repeat protein